MTRREVEEQLNILIELELYRIIKVTLEGDFSNKKELIEKSIQDFENSLPEWFHAIPDIHTFVITKLKEMEKEEKRIEEMRRKAKEEKER